MAGKTPETEMARRAKISAALREPGLAASRAAKISAAHRGRPLSQAHRDACRVAHIHGHAMGGVVTRTYRTWVAMKFRCSNPAASDFRYYGGRGISVCERWIKFENFLEDMGERPAGRTLDRVDNEGNYEPANCRWATWKEQSLNKRRRGTA
jgi:hypothetical protein